MAGLFELYIYVSKAVNPIMILIYIPIFIYLIYPAINKVFTLTPIRKISIGLFVMVVGFAMVAILQESIDQGNRPSIGWQILAYALLTASEVMVSITCLEFSYTQAPKKMKSLIYSITKQQKTICASLFHPQILLQRII